MESENIKATMSTTVSVTTSTTEVLRLENIKKSFGEAEVLRGISFAAEAGEFITLLGPSGCGKTTTLRIIAGLEEPDDGRVILGGEDVTNEQPNKRNVNTVFQSYALFPHMNVEANVGYSLKIKKTPKAEIKKAVDEMLSLVQLEGYNKRMPSELSGGQRQRVAIARSLINKPRILLLDEPLGALDLQLRRQMQIELKSLQQKTGITFIYITHDQEEALTMSDRIAVMDKGLFQQIGTPAEVYDTPKTSFVAQFVGSANLIKATVKSTDGKLVYAENDDGKICFESRGYTFTAGQEVSLAVRGEQAQLAQEDKNSETALAGKVKEKSFAGGMLRIAVILRSGGEFICSWHGIDSPIKVGDSVVISWSPEHAAPVDMQAEGEA